MLKVMKKRGKIVQAYRLGEPHSVLDCLMKTNKIIDLHNGMYEIFSQEAVKAGSGHGQLACTGDWVRIDGAGFPYPNRADWFQENLRHISGDNYEQIPKLLYAWTSDMEICPEIQFLIQKKGLILNKNNPDQYFKAFLWNTQEVAAKDAVLIFYSISYDESGKILDAKFNFVERAEFERTYDILSKCE